MKKAFIFIMSMLLFFTLTSCATIRKNVELSQDSAQIQSLEIYDVSHKYYEGDVTALRKENTPIHIIDAESQSEFLDDLRTLEFEEVVFFFIPMDGGCDYSGYVIAVVYSNGGYDIIAEEGLFSYAVGEDGEGRYRYDHSDYCGEQSWAEFIEGYID